MPLLICALLGFAAVWKARKQEFYYPVLFVATLGLLSYLWRLPVALSTRHLLPLMVPVILLATLFFQTAWSARWRIAKSTCAIIFLIVIISGAGKAIRPQVAKPYLRELPIALTRDAEKFGGAGKTYVITLGNMGGDLLFDERIIDVSINDSRSFDRNREAFFQSLDAQRLRPLLLQRPVVYLVVRSVEPDNVVADRFRKRYDLPFELCYQARDRKKGVYLYRIPSPYASGKISAEARNRGYDQFNLLSNHDFQIRENAGSAPFPAEWRAELNGRCPKILPGMIGYADSGNLRLKTPESVFLYQDRALPGNRKYQLRARVVVRESAYFFIDVKRRHPAGLKLIRRVVSQTLYPGKHELLEIFALTENEDPWIWEFGIVGGELEVESLSLVDAAGFDAIERLRQSPN